MSRDNDQAANDLAALTEVMTSRFVELEPTAVQYLLAVQRALRIDAADILPWLTDQCPECQEHVWVEGAASGDATVRSTPTHDLVSAHVTVGTAVAIGCEGYWVIAPSALGIDRENWLDWRGGI